MKICIPSHRRAATISTHRLLPDAIVCVPESQVSDYEQAGLRTCVTHPDSIRGLTPKLNWMLDHLADYEGIIFLDDDLEYLCRCFTDRTEREVRKVTEARLIKQILKHTAAAARELGAFFFGWESSESTIRYYSGLEPFKFTGFVNGCAMGFIAGHGLRFDESIVAKNDYDICALNAFRHRVCLKDTRYAFCHRATFTGSGGQSFFRNSETEVRDIAILRRKYGELIVIGKQDWTVKRIDEIDEASSSAVNELLSYLDYLPAQHAVLASTNNYSKLRANTKGRLETRFVRFNVGAPSVDDAFGFLKQYRQLPANVAKSIALGAVPEGCLPSEGVNMRACIKDADGYYAATAARVAARVASGKAVAA